MSEINGSGVSSDPIEELLGEVERVADWQGDEGAEHCRRLVSVCRELREGLERAKRKLTTEGHHFTDTGIQMGTALFHMETALDKAARIAQGGGE